MKKIIFIIAILLILVGLYLRKFETYGPEIIIENPIVSIYPIEETPFKASWSKGYEFTPLKKKRLDSGESLLIYHGEIRNPTLSLSDYKIDFKSFKKDENCWRGKNKSGEDIFFKTPEVTLEHINSIDYESYYTKTFKSTPESKNLQPDGRIILSAKVSIDSKEYAIILPSSLNYKSIRVKDGHFTVKKSM